MSENYALNQRLLARRLSADNSHIRTIRTNLARIDELTVEFYRLLKANSYPHDPGTGLVALWLKHEYRELNYPKFSYHLAWMLATSKYFEKGSGERSSMFVELNGDLVMIHKSETEPLVFGDIEKYRDRTERLLEDPNSDRNPELNLHSETQEVMNRLHYMISCLHRL